MTTIVLDMAERWNVIMPMIVNWTMVDRADLVMTNNRASTALTSSSDGWRRRRRRHDSDSSIDNGGLIGSRRWGTILIRTMLATSAKARFQFFE